MGDGRGGGGGCSGNRLPVGDGAFPSVCPSVAMDTAAVTEQQQEQQPSAAAAAEQPAQDGPAAAADTPVPDGPAAAADTPVQDGPAGTADIPVPEAPASVDDRPQKHGITDELAHLFLKRFLPADTRFVMKSYKYRPIASLGEGYTTVRKVLDIAYRDEKSGKEGVAAFVVKVPSEY